MSEHQHTKWKESWRDDHLRRICGFDNADGGVLVIGWNDKGMAVGVPKHPSCRYNPLVANAFFRAEYIESWGRGIKKIRQECIGHGIEPPVYDFGMAGLMLTFHANPEHVGEAGEATGEAPGKPSVKTSVKILELLRQNPEMTLAEVATQVNRSLRAVELASSKLVKAGKLKHDGPQKGGPW